MKITKSLLKQIIKEELMLINEGRGRPGLELPWKTGEVSTGKYRLADPHTGKGASDPAFVNPKWDNKTKMAWENLRATQKKIAADLKRAMDNAAMRPDSSFDEIVSVHETIDAHQARIMSFLQILKVS